MIFPNGRAIFGLNALAGHTRPHHFGQAINVYRINAHAVFNGRTHVIGPWLCTKYSYSQ